MVAVGRGLTLLGSRDFRALGSTRIADLIELRFGVSAGWAYDARHCAEDLPRFPLLEKGFLAGVLCVTKVRALLRIVSPETEAAWVEYACRRSATDVVRRTRDATPPAERVPIEGRATVSWLALPWEVAGWHWGRAMICAVAGRTLRPWEVAEVLAADSLAGGARADGWEPLGLLKEAVDEPPADPPPPPPDARTLARLTRLLEHVASPPVLDLPELGDEPTVHELDAHVRAALRLLAKLEFERASLLSLMKARGLHVPIYGSVAEYALAQLGMSGRELGELLDLHTATRVSGSLSSAWSRRMSTSTLRLITKVATPQTAREWISFARKAGRKRLADEVEWHEAALPAMGRETYLRLTHGLPDPDATPTQRRLDFREFFRVPLPGTKRLVEAAELTEDVDPDDVMLGTLLGDALHAVSFDAPVSVAELFRTTVLGACNSIEQQTGRRPTFGSAVLTLMIRFAHAHVATDSPEMKRWMREHVVFERDGWRCANPSCGARCDLHAHHIIFQSRGGPDDEWNLITLCWRCHRAVHDGQMEVTGRAPDGLTFRFGPRGDGTWRETWRNGMRIPSLAGLLRPKTPPLPMRLLPTPSQRRDSLSH